MVAQASVGQNPQFVEHSAPGGLWATLAVATESPRGPGDVWQTLALRAAADGSSSGELWATLAQQTDPAQYRPAAIPDVAEEFITEDSVRMVVLRSPRGNYLRLTEPQRALWRNMDGTRTVAQLAMEGLKQFKQLLPVGDLVNALRQEGFLIDQPVGVYRVLGSALEARTVEGSGRRFLRILAGQRWQFQNIDGFYSALYGVGGWFLFTPIFAALWGVFALSGLLAFVALLVHPEKIPNLVGDSVPLAVVSVWCALLVSFVLHESAHALAVKHFGRTLRGGGMMLYFGAPAFFVDTSDIWRSPARARIFVSAAGPMSDLLIGGAAALLVWFGVGGAFAGGVLYKLALTCYIATLFNANPLLELDGYFVLVDLLRLPDLRRRSLDFVRGPLWAKLRGANTNIADTVNHFTRDERIFTLYGILTLIYTLVAIAFAFQFWNRVLLNTIVELLTKGGPLQRMLAAALLLLVVVPVLIGLAFAALGIGRTILRWIVRRGYGRQPALLAACGLVIALGVAWLTTLSPAGTLVMAPALWVLAMAGLLAVRPDYLRAAVAPTINALAVMTGLSALAVIARAAQIAPVFWVTADALAFVFLLLAGLAALLDVDLRMARQRELVLTALLLMLAFAAGGAALQISPVHGAVAQIVVGAPAYFGALALALLLPHLFDLHDSRLFWAWGLMWLATLSQTAAFIADLSGPSTFLDIFTAASWAAAWLVHLATLRQIAPDEIEWPHAPSISEEERLRRAFQFCYAGCYRLLRAVYGARRTRALDDRMDVLAATANWAVTLDRENARIAQEVQKLPLDQQGARYAEVLRYTVSTIEDLAGATFARRAIQAAYDALPWPERETASRYCFPDTPWARELSSVFGDVREARLRLLRQLDQFVGCDDDELATLAHAMKEQNVAAGTEIWRAAVDAPGVWLVEAGEIVVVKGKQVVAELHRGEAFGGDAEPDSIFRAAIVSSLLFLSSEELAHVPTANLSRDTTTATLRLLERVPLFSDLPRNTLLGLAMVAQERRFPPRAVIVREGVPSGVFYIVKNGRVAVLTRDADGANGKMRVVARLGREEFFGELELLRGTPPVASVVATEPLLVLAFPHAALEAFIIGDGRVAKELQQIGTGRLLALRTET